MSNNDLNDYIDARSVTPLNFSTNHELTSVPAVVAARRVNNSNSGLSRCSMIYHVLYARNKYAVIYFHGIYLRHRYAFVSVKIYPGV